MPHLSDKNKTYLSIVLRQIRAVNITIFIKINLIVWDYAIPILNSHKPTNKYTSYKAGKIISFVTLLFVHFYLIKHSQMLFYL